MAESELRTVTGHGGRAESTGDGPRLPVGRSVVDRYEIIETIGKGGMGVVYRAHDSVLARDVAIKMLATRGGGGEAERVIEEAKSLAKLSHPNVVVVHDAGTVGEQCFLAMELVEGETLKSEIERGDRGVKEIVRTLLAAGRGLAAAHAAGVIHRDFKPSNVLVGADGRVRVADFGLATSGATRGQRGEATSSGAELSDTGSQIPAGTPAYMAPELFDGHDADALADQYSFCVALWEALSGSRPHSGANIGELARAKRNGAPDELDRPGVSARLIDVLSRGLAARPDQRFASMGELLGELERAARPRGRRLALAGALVAVTAAAASLLVVTSSDDRLFILGDLEPAALSRLSPTHDSDTKFAALERDLSRATDELGADHLEVARLHETMVRALRIANAPAAQIASHLEDSLRGFRFHLGPAHPSSREAQFWLIFYRLAEGRAAEHLIPAARELVSYHDKSKNWKGWVEAAAMLGRVLYEAGELDEAREIGLLVWNEAIEHRDHELKSRIEAYWRAHGLLDQHGNPVDISQPQRARR